MPLRRLVHNTLLALACLAAWAPAYALDATDLPQLKAGTVLAVADAKGETAARDIAITHVHPVRSEGSVWYQINGTSGSGQEEVLYADFSASPPKLEMVVRRVVLKKLVDRPRKFLDAVEEEGKGELLMDGVAFAYTDAESDDGVFETDGNPAQAFEFNYLVFTSSKDATLSIQVMRWDDEKLDAYLVKRVSADTVQRKAP